MSKKRALRCAVSVLLICVLLHWIGLDRVRDSWQGADASYLALALVVTLFDRIWMPLKWKPLLDARGVFVSWWEAIRVYYICSFLGLFLPPTVGADALRAFWLGRRRNAVSELVASIVLERLLGLIVLMIFGVVGCLLCLRMFAGMEHLLWTSVLLVTAAVGGFAFSMSAASGRMVDQLARRCERWPWTRTIADKTAKTYALYQDYRGRKLLLTMFLLATILQNVLVVLRAYLIARALHVEAPFLYFLMLIPIKLLLIRIPVSVDGFGIHEGVFVFFLTRIGVSEATAFSVGLANHLMFLVALLPGGLLYLFGREKQAALSASSTDAVARPAPVTDGGLLS